MKKHGFTLVELSIVLVIIGLLIGGILVGQSMIESAKIQAFVRQIQQFDAAANAFKTKYRCLPGDDNKFSTTGNCDGLVTSSSQDDYFNQEIALYWVNLIRSSSLGGKLTGLTVSSAFVPDITFPLMKAGTNCGVLVASTTAAADVLKDYISGNFYSVQNLTLTNAGTGALSVSPCLTVAQALSIDSKLDDGNGFSGTIIPGFATTTDLSSFNTIASPSNLCYNTSTGRYLTDNAGDNCSLHIKLLSSQ